MTEFPNPGPDIAGANGRYGVADLAGPAAILREYWVLALGALILAVPTMFDVARENWSTEQGAHGPIVLATGLWLFWRRWPEIRHRRELGDARLAIAGFVAAASLYILARVTGVIEVEGFMMYGLLLITAYWLIGIVPLRTMWFPIVYTLFIFPPPDTVVAMITQPLKIGISQIAINLLHGLGFPIAGSGFTIVIGQSA